ncbi:MAG: tetratricopeptide repeat protein [Candidatus Hydrogenedentes bacterium]|nr:tetratricopeptide repeat protein [Candidatus Hydrogenedentota bacterium]
MAELWELVRYVEAHPNDFAQRWRLAKKLYMAWEYRLALEHLQVLKKEWTRKLNVLRYLSATYYRLGRYEESVTELEAAIAIWPNDVSLREQMARVLEVAGRRLDAGKVWEEILEMSPQHPLASRSVRRLQTASKESPSEELHLADSDSGISLRAMRICPSCGAQNSVEFDRCWQCHATVSSLAPTPGPASAVTPKPARKRKVEPWVWTLTFGLVTVALLAAGLFLTLQAYARSKLVLNMPEDHTQVYLGAPEDYTTVYAELAETLWFTRVLVGGALVIVWPLVLRLSVVLFRAHEVPIGRVVGVGTGLAALAYLSSWSPMAYLAYAPILPAIGSLLIILLAFGLSFPKALGVWVAQMLFVITAGVTLVIALEGTEAVTQVPQTLHYAAAHDAVPNAGISRAPEMPIPATWRVQWTSSGSNWLDKKVAGVVLDIQGEATSPMPTVEFRDGTQTFLYKDMPSYPFRIFRYPVKANHPYEVLITGNPGAKVVLTMYGALRPSFGN